MTDFLHDPQTGRKLSIILIGFSISLIVWAVLIADGYGG